LRINAETVVTDNLRLTQGEQSTSTTTGDLTVAGGVGIIKNLNVGGDVTVDGTVSFTGITTVSDSLLPDTDLGASIGSSTKRFDDAFFGNIRIAVADDNTIDTSAGNLILDAATNIVDINAATNITGNTVITGILSVTDDITAFFSSDQRLKDNITPINDPLAKVLSISGNTYDWNEKSGKEGHDVGVIAQEVLEVLPEAVTTRDNGYLAVDYQKIVPLLVEAVKELSAKVKDLENK